MERAMNRLASFAALTVVALTVAAAFFYFNPHHLPRFFRPSTQGLQLPEPRSPVANFRPPQF
jgi:hypothetical protein